MKNRYNEIVNIVGQEINSVKFNMTNNLFVVEPLKSKFLALLNAPSKHIRPLLSFLYLKSLGLDIDEKQILFQSAIEIVHNASLIHDDIIDESLSRRGVATINNEFGNKLAVISGDYLLSVALDMVIKLEYTELIQMFSDTLAVMSVGEINQYFNKFKMPTLDEYIEKSKQKTAKLFETSVCGSLLIANSTQNGRDFAENFGIAFQIRDDLINCKTTNSDVMDGIYNAPIIFSGSNNITEEAIEKTKILLNNYLNRAAKCLVGIEDNEYKLALIELLELIKYE